MTCLVASRVPLQRTSQIFLQSVRFPRLGLQRPAFNLPGCLNLVSSPRVSVALSLVVDIVPQHAPQQATMIPDVPRAPKLPRASRYGVSRRTNGRR